ncbi:MAG: HDOD domain-containing protein [Candidatus Cloacimonetes bacterium]|nr:HDOD domain-containing protein [Candidatus Cloacimonadota bacterium]
MNLSEEKLKIIKKIIELANSSSIASIKNTVIQLISLINNPDSSALDLRNILELDPPLTAQVLRRANSALYAPPRKINDIREAIIWIGFEQVKEIALSQKIFEFFKMEGVEEGFSGEAMWKHSIATALFAKYIYRREFRLPGINVYTAGLLHDIGIVIENQFLPEEFSKLIKKSVETKQCLYYAEDMVLGFNHTIVGFKLAENWNFPTDLCHAIAFHHTPDNRTINDTKMVSTIFIADRLAQMNKFGFCDENRAEDEIFKRTLLRLNITKSALDLLTETVLEELKKMEASGIF